MRTGGLPIVNDLGSCRDGGICGRGPMPNSSRSSRSTSNIVQRNEEIDAWPWIASRKGLQMMLNHRKSLSGIGSIRHMWHSVTFGS